MQEMGIDNLINKAGSLYKLVIMTFMRAIELSEGAAKLVEAKPDVKPISLALKEIFADKITYKVKEK